MTDMGAPGPTGRRLRRGAYLLPSLFTIGNMLLGFYAVVRGYRGDFQVAAILIFIAAVLDTLDGRIARMTGTESAFGREYDSLADVVTFGAVPALLAFFWGLVDLGRVGWLAPTFFMVCCATRLARFNVLATQPPTEHRDFVGLPAPAAAGAIASLLFFAPDHDWRPWAAAGLTAALLAIGALMVSTFRYKSFKKLDLRKRWSYRAALPLAAILLVVALHPPAVFLVASGLYALSGPAGWLLGRRRPAS
jgi:CDP-diacylglycerol--serine O-phosphatidyltransferase